MDRDYTSPDLLLTAAGHGYHEGDLVECLGAKGTITKISDAPYTLHSLYPIEVLMESGRELHFTVDGKILTEMTEKVLVVTGKKPKTVKRWQWLYKMHPGANRYEASIGHYTEEEWIISNKSVLEGSFKVESSMVEGAL